MCGIIGVVAGQTHADAPARAMAAMAALQHRGQDAAGMAYQEHMGAQLVVQKGAGLVSEAVDERAVVSEGVCAIGHVRYPTSGGKQAVQPFVATSKRFGRVALAHNGTLSDLGRLAQEAGQSAACGCGGPSMHVSGSAVTHTDTEAKRCPTQSNHAPALGLCDTELMLHVLVRYLDEPVAAAAAADDAKDDAPTSYEAELVLDAVMRLMAVCSGGYACVALVERVGLVVFRDPHGVRPLCYSASAHAWAAASESVALDPMDGADTVHNVMPGQAIVVASWDSLRDASTTAADSKAPYLARRRQAPWAAALPRPCAFEFVYFAHPASVIDGVSVYAARLGMGRRLAERLRVELGEDELQRVEAIVPVPETARHAATEVARVLGIPLREALVRNRYAPGPARTFIMPDQASRERAMARKLVAIRDELRGKAVILVDDSIVRGTTSRRVIALVRDAGATHVYLASASPPVLHANRYGIDIPSEAELVARRVAESADSAAIHELDVARAVAARVGADRVVYQQLDGLVAACFAPGAKLCGVECLVFDGIPLPPLSSP
jgi:amidophosphoribosyltransferase